MQKSDWGQSLLFVGLFRGFRCDGEVYLEGAVGPILMESWGFKCNALCCTVM